MVEAASLGNIERSLRMSTAAIQKTKWRIAAALRSFAYSTAETKPILPQRHFVFDYPGSVAFRAIKDEYTLCRFDGDNGEYSLLMGTGKGIDGPYNQGTYLYLEFANLNRLEFKLVEGPIFIMLRRSEKCGADLVRSVQIHRCAARFL